MPVKVFTLVEANRLLPTVEKTILWLQGAVREIVRLQDAISVLAMLGADGESSPERAEMEAKQAKLESLVQTYSERLEEVQKLGCVLKDINMGVIDFYGLKDGRLVFLCWRMGEKSIEYWHEINAGMIGRRPVSEL